MDWKYFLRQITICSGSWTLYFMQRLALGFPTVVVPQLRLANQTISDDLAAWIPTAHAYGGIPWVILLSGLTISIGRKKSYIVVCLAAALGFIIFFVSQNITHLLISELFLASLGASFMTICIIILTEFASSKNRGIFLTIKSATFFWGILAVNAIGTFCKWQTIGIFGMICAAYSLVHVIYWPESPLWLASKGKFEECAKAHRWLKGEDEESEKELRKLLKAYEHVKFFKPCWKSQNTLKIVYKKSFWKPLLLIILLLCLYCFSGKLICTVFAIEVLKKVTKSESSAYSGMLILDGVTVFSMYVGCFLSRVLKRRVMLMSFTALGIMFLLLISLYLYLVQISIIENNVYISIVLLAGYSISISIGPMILCTSIVGELLPLQARSLSICVIALSFKFIYGSFLKISPFIFRKFGVHGTFLLYAILSLILVVLVYVYIPETKDKTLQEIHDGIRNKEKRDVAEASELMNITINVT